MSKIIVSCNAPPLSDEKRDALVKKVADALGVLVEDVVLLPCGTSVSVVDVPGDLCKAREKQEAHEKHEAEKKAKEEESARKDAEHHTKIHSHAKAKE